MKFTQAIEIDLHECGVCGGFIAVTDRQWQTAQRNGTYFTCPNGHAWGFKETEAQRQSKRAEDAEAEARRLAADRDGLLRKIGEQEKVMKRVTKRANAGVCLDCHRTFQDVARHRATKHPLATQPRS